ncbi:ferrochelatase [Sulfurimonas sp.]|uniref:ferrochelatase n=1 Tax=Sulfurimonas sp. TaxID=2022749 RepID=UPI0025D76E5D|nr:ferrochelatase [Sulfurimonas sp.]
MKKEAIVLLNMGGPNNLDEVEVFLKNMFNDKNILTFKSDFLRSILANLITFSRAEKSQGIYREIGGSSPIVSHTRNLVERLQSRVGNGVVVDFAMRYTPPYAEEAIERLNREEIDRIYLIPLYPQYSTTTTKSSLEDFEEVYLEFGGDAILSEIKHFFQNQTFNRAIIERIKEAVGDDPCSEFDIIFLAHGLPQKIIDNGDVYEQHINRHVEILSNLLKDEGMDFHEIHLAYQSKVGPMKWLKPSLEEKLEYIRNRGVIIYPISFTIDNSETDYELDIEYRELAHEFGFKHYRVCRCLNDSDIFVDALAEIYHKMQ